METQGKPQNLGLATRSGSKIRLPRRSTVQQMDQKKGVHGVSEIGSPTSLWLPLRAHGGWRVLARDLLCPQANSNGPEADVHWLHQEECPNSLVSFTVLCGVAFPMTTLSLQKLHLTVTGTLGNDVKKTLPFVATLVRNSQTISDQSR